MNDYLSKPLDPHQLLAMAHRWTASAGQEPKRLAASARPAVKDFDAVALVDELALGRLRAILPAAKLKTIIQTYVATDFLSEIEKDAAAKDFHALGHAAHTCKGTSANIGASRLAAVAKELETACQAEDGGAVSRLLPEMRRVTDLTRLALRPGAPIRH
jgi:hypothetical protein